MKDVITEDLQLLFGDCLERMKEIPDGSVDAIVSDIPYGIDFDVWDITINEIVLIAEQVVPLYMNTI